MKAQEERKDIHQAIEKFLQPIDKDQETVMIDDMVFHTATLKNTPHSATGFLTNPWIDGIVYYRFDSTVTQAMQKEFMSAFHEWQIDTPINFVERTTEENYILIMQDHVNSSYVGMVGGEQLLRFSNQAKKGTLLHELGYAIGLYHEHQRGDRNEYIKIFPENAHPDSWVSLHAIFQTINFTSYDFLSIMHYWKNAFSVNGENTIEPKEQFKEYLDKMGQRDSLSAFDKEGVRKLYDQIPELISPQMNETNIPLNNINLTWGDVPGGQEYQVQVSADNAFATILVDTFVSVTTLGSYNSEIRIASSDVFKPQKTYFWRVRTKFEDGVKAWSQVGIFTTSLDAVTLLAPADEATNQFTELVLVWEKCEFAQSYHPTM